MQDVTDLIIYRNAINLVKPLQQLANLLPADEFRLKGQLLDAGRSIPAHIAEGFAKRRSQAEFRRFLEMAIGSSDEAVTHIRVILISGFKNVKNETKNNKSVHFHKPKLAAMKEVTTHIFQ